MMINGQNERFLKLVAGIMADGADVTVCVTSRVRHPATVVFESRNVVLHPSAQILDLCVAARLMRFRPDVRSASEVDALSDDQQAKWVRIALETLVSDFPQIEELPGTIRSNAPDTWPKFTWSQVEFSELEQSQIGEDGSLVCHTGLEVAGAEDDLTLLINAVSAGRYPLEHWDALHEIPIATVPLKLPGAVAMGLDFEDYEDELKSLDVRNRIEAIKKCYVRKSEDTSLRMFAPTRQAFGVRIDSSRLADAVLMRRSGLSPRVFRARDGHNDRRFDPSRHYALIAFDTNVFSGGSLSDPAFNRTWLGTVIEVYRDLQIDFSVVAYSDQLVDLPGGKGQVMFHMPTVLKEIDQPADIHFYRRLWSLAASPPGISQGLPCCFLPLQLRSVLQSVTDHLVTGEYSHAAILMVTQRGMPRIQRFRQPHFLSRAANTMDDLYAAFERNQGVEFECLCMIPETLKASGKRGGFTASQFASGGLG